MNKYTTKQDIEHLVWLEKAANDTSLEISRIRCSSTNCKSTSIADILIKGKLYCFPCAMKEFPL